MWKALADASRREILDRLREGPKTTGWLAERFEMSRFGVMKHLDVLLEAGLISVERRGRERWNHLNPVPMRQAYERWMAPYAEQAAVTALRLKDAVEAKKGRAMEISTMDVRSEVRIEGARHAVFEMLVDMDAWWPHRYHEGSTVTLDLKAGGVFAEHWPGGSRFLGVVSSFENPVRLTVSGSMGTYRAITGSWEMTLAEQGTETLLTVHHTAFGDLDDEIRRTYTEGWPKVLDALAQAVQKK